MKCVCPDSNLEKHERIREIFRNIEEWIQSDALQSLVRLFGGEKMETAPLKAQIQWLNNFVEIWDYRARNQNTDVNERWNVFDDEFVLKHKDEIMNCATELGLVQETTAVRIPDYIIPLGGARYSNLDRPVYAGNDICMWKITFISSDSRTQIYIFIMFIVLPVFSLQMKCFFQSSAYRIKLCDSIQCICICRCPFLFIDWP